MDTRDGETAHRRGDAMTPYRKCPKCGAIRMRYQTLDIGGKKKKVRICFKCFMMQEQVKVTP